MTIQEQLRGWGMDVEALKGEGAFLSPPKVPRAFSTNVSNDLPTNPTAPTYEWDHYSGLPGTGAYN